MPTGKSLGFATNAGMFICNNQQHSNYYNILIVMHKMIFTKRKWLLMMFICCAVASFIMACGKNSSPNPGSSNTNNIGNNSGGGTSQNTLAITDFSPKTAKPETTITITGTGFGNDPSKVKVAIGSSPYDVPISVTPTTIVTKTNLATPSGKISVIVDGNRVSSTSDFASLPEDLKISYINGILTGEQGSSQLGHYVFIYAHGLYASGGVLLTKRDTNSVSISFGGTAPVKPFDVYNSVISAVMPRYAQAGKVTLTVGNRSTTTEDNFKIDMSMRDFTPKTFTYGDTIKITGEGFTTIKDMDVHFVAGTCCEVLASPISVTPTQMLVIVPYNTGITSGSLSISSSVKIGDGNDASDVYPVKYTIKK